MTPESFCQVVRAVRILQRQDAYATLNGRLEERKAVRERLDRLLVELDNELEILPGEGSLSERSAATYRSKA